MLVLITKVFRFVFNCLYYSTLGDDMSRNAKKKPAMTLKEKRALKRESNREKEEPKARKRRA